MIGSKKLVGKIHKNTSNKMHLINASKFTLRNKSQRITSKKRCNADEGFEVNNPSCTAGSPMTKDMLKIKVSRRLTPTMASPVW